MCPQRSLQDATKVMTEVYTKTLNLLNIICRDTLCHSTTLHIGPSIATVTGDQDKPITLGHGPLRIAASFVVVQRLHIL